MDNEDRQSLIAPFTAPERYKIACHFDTAYDVELAQEVGVPAACLFNRLVWMNNAHKEVDDGWIWYTAQRFKAETLFKERTFAAAGKKLEEAGYVERRVKFIKNTYNQRATHFRLTGKIVGDEPQKPGEKRASKTHEKQLPVNAKTQLPANAKTQLPYNKIYNKDSIYMVNAKSNIESNTESKNNALFDTVSNESSNIESPTESNNALFDTVSNESSNIESPTKLNNALFDTVSSESGNSSCVKQPTPPKQWGAPPREHEPFGGEPKANNPTTIKKAAGLVPTGERFQQATELLGMLSWNKVKPGKRDADAIDRALKSGYTIGELRNIVRYADKDEWCREHMPALSAIFNNSTLVNKALNEDKVVENKIARRRQAANNAPRLVKNPYDSLQWGVGGILSKAKAKGLGL